MHIKHPEKDEQQRLVWLVKYETLSEHEGTPPKFLAKKT